jgi:hypothetical protein
MLTINPDQEQIRQDARENKQTSKWIKVCHTQMNNFSRDSIKPHLLARENNSAEQPRTIHTETVDLLQQ